MGPKENIRKSGAFDMQEGDRVLHTLSGRYGIAGEFTQDGDCFVKFESGVGETVKWNHLKRAPKT